MPLFLPATPGSLNDLPPNFWSSLEARLEDRLEADSTVVKAFDTKKKGGDFTAKNKAGNEDVRV